MCRFFFAMPEGTWYYLDCNSVMFTSPRRLDHVDGLHGALPVSGLPLVGKPVAEGEQGSLASGHPDNE
jgi:hypothetical protein